MMHTQVPARVKSVAWLARAALAAVFALNVSCALEFVLRPAAYAPSFELAGVPGQTMVRGLGILFLMWNSTYPLPLWDPWRFRALYAVLLAQQAIGVAGETALLLALPAGHATLAASGWRFVAFDSAGLALLLAALLTLVLVRRCAGRG
jgi:hypothetical protein